MPCARSLANLKLAHAKRGPSPLALPIMRALIHVPMTILQLVRCTGFSERTCRAQIEWLMKSEAVHRDRFISPGFRSGARAVYKLELTQL